MSLWTQTMLLYLVVGFGVAGAVYLVDGAGPRERWFRVVSALPFWPLYLPVLLTGTGRPEASERPGVEADEMALTIDQVDAELERALGSLDGWAVHVLANEREKIRELRRVWTFQAERIRQMDRLLQLPPAVDSKQLLAAPSGACSAQLIERVRLSNEGRRQNLERLQRIRQRAYEDLMGTLAWVRELVSMIHLARFTGAPAARAEELVAQIAAAVEGLSAVTEEEALSECAGGNTSAQG